MRTLQLQVFGNGYVGRLRVLGVLCWALLALVFVEVAFQIRSFRQTGESIFSSWAGTGQYQLEPESGLKLLRPNAVIHGKFQEIRSNSLGLRSPELPSGKANGEFRIAVLGASTVMGAYAVSNAQTIPAYIEAELRQRAPTASWQLINAGVVGYGVSEQLRLLQYVLDKTAPDILIVYPGSNDFASFCRKPASQEQKSAFAFPRFELPKWLMSVDLLRKNTVALRVSGMHETAKVDAKLVDLSAYRAGLESMVELSRSRNVPIVFSTISRAYRPDQPKAMQEALSRTARYYNPCFDVQGLHSLYDRTNELIRSVGLQAGVSVIPVDPSLPGGREYFVDATHPNDLGNRRIAELMAAHILNLPALGPVASP